MFRSDAGQATLYHGQDAVRVHDTIRVAADARSADFDAVYDLEGF